MVTDFFKHHSIQRFVERAIALAERQPIDQIAGSEIPIWLPFKHHPAPSRADDQAPAHRRRAVRESTISCAAPPTSAWSRPIGSG